MAKRLVTKLSRYTAVLCAVVIGILGVSQLTSSSAATPVIGLEPEAGTTTAPAVVLNDSNASGGQAVSFSSSAPATCTTYPAAGQVGFKGDPATLQVIEGPHYISGSATLDKVYIKGGLYHSGNGTVTVTNSIIEGGRSWFILRMEGGQLNVSDSTLRWNATGGVNPDVGNGSGAILVQGASLNAYRNDISGNPDGIQMTSGTVECNWVHNLAMVGTYPNNTHNDGIQIFSGTGRIAYNRFETGAQSPYSNAALFFQCSCTNWTIDGNYLDGGGYSLYIENGNHAVRNNTFGPNRLWGPAILSGGTISEWTNNKMHTGETVARP